MSDPAGFLLWLEGVAAPLTVPPDETVLAALERAGYRMRKSCRNGVCEICEVTLRHGTLSQRYPQRIIDNNNSDKCNEGVTALACTAYPLTDVWVKIEGLQAPGEQTVKKLVCAIQGIEQLNHDVYRVRLQLPATGTLAADYLAGQYLDLLLPDGRQASFSIGSAPEQGRMLELHIRHLPDSDMSNAVVEHLKTQASVTVELPKGDCYLQATRLHPDTRIVLAAASTGFAQVKSVVEHLLANQVSNPLHVYWGARVEADIYLERLPQQWESEHANVTFIPVVSEPENSPGWSGRTGLLPDAILEDFDDFDGVEIFASGSPGMVYALLDAAETRGFDEANMHSDVFAYAPRK